MLNWLVEESGLPRVCRRSSIGRCVMLGDLDTFGMHMRFEALIL